MVSVYLTMWFDCGCVDSNISIKWYMRKVVPGAYLMTWYSCKNSWQYLYNVDVCNNLSRFPHSDVSAAMVSHFINLDISNDDAYVSLF